MAGDPFRRYRFRIARSVLTGSDGTSARILAGREAGCPARSLQTDSSGCRQRGWVWCCRAPRYEVKLQAVSG